MTTVESPVSFTLPSGTFRLGPCIGEGGSARVHEAVVDNERLAIKVLRWEFTSDAEVLARFTREVETVNALQHPYVPKFHGFGACSDGRPFAAFSLVEGETLRARMLRGAPLTVTQALVLLDDLLEVLALAHQKGVLHRDIKPSNIVLAADGAPYLLDFGLAHLLDQPADLSITALGVAVGTPAYMPPEMARAERERYCPATDLFALALTIASGMAGKTLRQHTAPADVLAEAQGPFPALRTFTLGIPRVVEALLDKALLPTPESRFATAEIMQRATRVVGRLLGISLPARRGGRTSSSVGIDATVLSVEDDLSWLPSDSLDHEVSALDTHGAPVAFAERPTLPEPRARAVKHDTPLPAPPRPLDWRLAAALGVAIGAAFWAAFRWLH